MTSSSNPAPWRVVFLATERVLRIVVACGQDPARRPQARVLGGRDAPLCRFAPLLLVLALALVRQNARLAELAGVVPVVPVLVVVVVLDLGLCALQDVVQGAQSRRLELAGLIRDVRFIGGDAQ